MDRKQFNTYYALQDIGQERERERESNDKIKGCCE